MRLVLGLSCVFLMSSQIAAEGKIALAQAKAPTPRCIAAEAPTDELERKQAYAGSPFQPGEEARYTLKYGVLKVHVGYGFLRVQPASRFEIAARHKEGQEQKISPWHRVFEAEAYTGDWFKMIYVAHDKIRVLSRPWDQAASHFYLNQDESKPFVRHFKTENWITFDHVNCQAHQRTVNHKNKTEKEEEFFLEAGASEVLSAFYRLRHLSYTAGRAESFAIYTSKKNWELVATPLKKESLETPLGKFETQKLQIQAYQGKELQKKGELFVWIAVDRAARPIVKIEADLGFSSVYLELDQYKEGSPH